MQPQKDWDGMINDSQSKLLERRMSSKKTKEQNWYIIYDVLFPGSRRPESPYLSVEFADRLLALRAFTACELPAIIHQVVEVETSTTTLVLDMESFAMRVFQHVFELLLERFENRVTTAAADTAQEQSRPLNIADQVYGRAVGETDVNGQARQISAESLIDWTGDDGFEDMFGMLWDDDEFNDGSTWRNMPN